MEIREKLLIVGNIILVLATIYAFYNLFLSIKAKRDLQKGKLYTKFLNQVYTIANKDFRTTVNTCILNESIIIILLLFLIYIINQ